MVQLNDGLDTITIKCLCASIITVTEMNEHFCSLVNVHKSLNMKDCSFDSYLLEINYTILIEQFSWKQTAILSSHIWHVFHSLIN